MSTSSPPDLLVLHAVRVLGYATTDRVRDRTGLDAAVVDDLLLDAQASGWVTWSSFAGDGGWSLSEAGKAVGEELVAVELDAVGARDLFRAQLEQFGPLNDLVAGACTRWQLTELGIADPPVPLDRVLADLDRAADGLATLESRLAARLSRFSGYHARFVAAVERAREEPGWISGTDRDSAHTVWFQLHEDLLATLGIAR